jgi:hypothetical protein
VIHLVNTDPPYNVKVEPRSNNAIAAGLSSFETTHHQKMDVVRHPEKAKPTGKKLRARDRPLVGCAVAASMQGSNLDGVRPVQRPRIPVMMDLADMAEHFSRAPGRCLAVSMAKPARTDESDVPGNAKALEGFHSCRTIKYGRTSRRGSGRQELQRRQGDAESLDERS